MPSLFSFLQWIFFIPAAGGSAYAILCLAAALCLRFRSTRQTAALSHLPPVTLLKPVRGLEKEQEVNLRSACLQDYPEYQVVFSVQESDDPALPLLYEVQREFGPERVTVAVENHEAGPNGKINNLIGGVQHARYDILVISDSDVRLKGDYLKTVVAPFADPGVGCVCTLYRAIRADRWFEKLELLTYNADFIPSVIFAHMTGASKFCLGPSLALTRSCLNAMGGFESLADYLVEDYEIGRRVWSSGKRVEIIPYFVDLVVSLGGAAQWWNHQVYWDQNTRAARPYGFLASVLTRSIPFAILFALLRSLDATGLIVLGGALFIRLTTAALIAQFGSRDREALRSILLLPFRDLAALASWVLAFTRKTVIWRESEFILTRDGRMLRKEAMS